MEQKHMLVWGLGLGVGVGLGVGLATGGLVKPIAGTPRASEILETELSAQVVDGKDSSITFDQFPYYLNEQTRVLLTNAAYVHLMQREFSKFTRNLSPASPAILLTGPAGSEAYQQMLAKALAHYFGAKLLLLDVSDFLSKVQSKYGELKLGLESASGIFPGVVADRINHLYVSLSDLAIQFPENIRRSFSSGSITPFPEKNKSSLKTSGSKKSLDGMSSPKKQDAELGVGKGMGSFRNGLYQGSPARRTSPRGFDDQSLIDALFKVLASVSQNSPIVLYLRDVEKLLFRGQKTYSLFNKKMKKLSGPVLILGSRILHGADTEEHDMVIEKLEKSFPYTISIKAPEDNARLVSWRSQLEEDMKTIEAQDNRNHILEVLAANDVECDDLASICFNDTLFLSNYIEEIAVSAISHHLMNTEVPNYRAGSLVISSKSLAYGLNLFQAGQLETTDSKLQAEVKSEPKKDPQETSAKPEVKAEVPVADAKSEPSKSDSGLEVTKKAETDGSKGVLATAGAKTEVAPDNEFEKRIRPEVIPAGEIGVSFADIGALENVKESLQELVMLPLRRPELFNKGGLIKPCRGILLFGPPGTGKTMLAKAVATEANASFINVSMSSITSKWFGEDEKNVRALFTLAAKVAPTIIFIDEVDSMLGQRSRVGEHEAMRKIKNEFMAHWDGLLSKGGERVLVLAATNRPFDLDEAIIRRFERRIMVALPDVQNREKILRRILSKELLSENFNFSELAVMTEGYSGSDLKNLCTTASYWPVRDLLKKEKEEAKKKKVQVEEKNLESSSHTNSEICKDGEKEAQNRANPPPPDNVNSDVLTFRPLTMEDMRQAKSQIASSFASEGVGMAELQEWNDLFGEGGSRKKQQLTYFM